MWRLIGFGLLAALFFSSTFVLNELMSVSGGHWFWSASLRYVFMWLILSAIILVQQGFSSFKMLCQLFAQHWRFGCVAGGIGFGLFYAPLCFGADHAAGWLIASTFEFTVVATLFVLAFFGQRFSKQITMYSLMVFFGVVLSNVGEALSHHQNQQSAFDMLLLGVFPALMAGFCFPIGNQLIWQSHQGFDKTQGYLNTLSTHSNKGKLLANIPHISSDLLNNSFNKVWFFTTGSLPFRLVLGIVVHPHFPSFSQTFNTFLVALCAGVLGTSVFLFARSQSHHSHELAAVDATQGAEVIFALVDGMVLLHTPMPSVISLAGIVMVIIGLILFAKHS